MSQPQGGVKMNVEVVGLDALLARIPNDAQRRRVAYNMLRKIGLSIEAKAKVLVHKRTGNTARSISTLVTESALIGYVGDLTVAGTARTALYNEKGTGLFGPLHHRIFPVHAKALRWPIGASGVGMERADMGLLSFTHGGVKYGAMPSGGKTLRLTGSHTAAHTKSGNAGFAVRRSIAGMRPQPFLMPAYEATLPLISVYMQEQAAVLFDGGLARAL